MPSGQMGRRVCHGCCKRIAGNLAAPVDEVGLGIISAQGAQVGHHAPLPEEGAILRRAGEAHPIAGERIGDRILGRADYLPGVIHIEPVAEAAAQRPQIGDMAMRKECGAKDWCAARGIDGAVSR